MRAAPLLFLPFLFSGCTLLFVERCGDGILTGGERCDDGNTEAGDGCDPGCLVVEGGFICPNPGEPCIADADCGDAVLEGAEECDEGANNSDTVVDACRTTCQKAFCGDGVVDTGEACDDGGTANGDGCDSVCLSELTVIDCSLEPGALQTALNNAASGDQLAFSGACLLDNATLNNKNISLIGVSNPIISSSGGPMLSILGSSQVRIENTQIVANIPDRMINISNNTIVAFINVTLSNINNSSAARALFVDQSSRLFIDQAIIQGNTSTNAAIDLRDSSQAIISNSLIVNNTSKDIIRALNTSTIHVVFSTFHNNNAEEQGIVECNLNAVCSLDSVAASNNGNDPIQNQTSMESCFVQDEDFIGNINVDPQFDAGFHIQNPVVLGSASQNPVVDGLVFDPLSLFGVDIFSHDLIGSSRPQGPRDPGAFEEN